MVHIKQNLWAAGALVCVPLVPLFFLAVAAVMHGRPEPVAAEPIPLTGAETDWVVGDKYELISTCGGQRFAGKLLKIGEHWIVLRKYETCTITDNNWFTELPAVGWLFEFETDKRSETDQWISRDAVTLETHRPGRAMPTVAGVLGAEPDAADYYAIELVRGGKIMELYGGLIAVTGDNLEFNISDLFDRGSYREYHPVKGQRQTIARSDLVCLTAGCEECTKPGEAE